MSGRAAFLFLGEMLLLPHLYPVVEALGRMRPDIRLDLWISTSAHERILRRLLPDGLNVVLRRAPGFREVADDRNPVLPNKLWMLARLAPALARTPVVLCAEQTSLWLPSLLPMRTRFLKTSHGVGSMSAREDRRRRAAWKLLVPSEMERRTYLDLGFTPEKVVATGYVKAAFPREQQTQPRFDADRPVLLYTPHWQRHRSSWWNWGPAILDRLIEQRRFNIIFAPHQRLVEGVPELREIVARVDRLGHVHADIDSFATVDGSYTAAADIYLGDTSSQVVEFLARPRPCLFLNSHHVEWRTRADHAFWQCGEVVDSLVDLDGALDRAERVHGDYRAAQAAFAEAALGDTSGEAPVRVAQEMLAALGRKNVDETGFV